MMRKLGRSYGLPQGGGSCMLNVTHHALVTTSPGWLRMPRHASWLIEAPLQHAVCLMPGACLCCQPVPCVCCLLHVLYGKVAEMDEPMHLYSSSWPPLHCLF
jgi:hypothetical protein